VTRWSVAEREELRLITSGADLQAGMYCEVRCCINCGAPKHRYLILSVDRSRRCNIHRNEHDTILHTTRSCDYGKTSCPGLAIEERRLYEVITGNDAVTEQAEGAADADKIINGIERMVRERTK
jgi:hypothetical protein